MPTNPYEPPQGAKEPTIGRPWSERLWIAAAIAGSLALAIFDALGVAISFVFPGCFLAAPILVPILSFFKLNLLWGVGFLFVTGFLFGLVAKLRG